MVNPLAAVESAASCLAWRRPGPTWPGAPACSGRSVTAATQQPTAPGLLVRPSSAEPAMARRLAGPTPQWRRPGGAGIEECPWKGNRARAKGQGCPLGAWEGPFADRAQRQLSRNGGRWSPAGTARARRSRRGSRHDGGGHRESGPAGPATAFSSRTSPIAAAATGLRASTWPTARAEPAMAIRGSDSSRPARPEPSTRAYRRRRGGNGRPVTLPRHVTHDGLRQSRSDTGGDPRRGGIQQRPYAGSGRPRRARRRGRPGSPPSPRCRPAALRVLELASHGTLTRSAPTDCPDR